MAIRHNAVRPNPSRPTPSRPRLRVLRSRRSWWTRFMDTRELFGLKVVLLGSCFFLAALVGA